MGRTTRSDYLTTIAQRGGPTLQTIAPGCCSGRRRPQSCVPSRQLQLPILTSPLPPATLGMKGTQAFVFAPGVPDYHHAVACPALAIPSRQPLHSLGFGGLPHLGKESPTRAMCVSTGWTMRVALDIRKLPFLLGLPFWRKQARPTPSGPSFTYIPLALCLRREYFPPRSRIYVSTLLCSRRVVSCAGPPPPMFPPHPAVASQSTMARYRVKEEDLRRK
jgi:hypothetical protein